MKRENLADCFNILALGGLFLAAALLSGCATREDRSDFGDRDYRALQSQRRSDAQSQKAISVPKPSRSRAR